MPALVPALAFTEAHSAGLGTGSEFIVRLPVLAANVEVLPAARSDPAIPADASRRVLVVDDNFRFRAVNGAARTFVGATRLRPPERGPRRWEAAHAAGFDVHVVKPADLDDLRRVLAHGRMRPEN
jgi:hypothetical protein